MSIKIIIHQQEYYDSEINEFFDVPETVLVLEHSLLSLTKWECKWHKPYLSRDEKTREETLDYIRCMSIGKEVDPKIFRFISPSDYNRILEYIKDPMTATTFSQKEKKVSREIITNELIYYWMTELNIPFDPCQKWHLNRLFTLIEVCAIKKQPPKKMSKKDIMRRNSALNAQRRARHGTRG